jgi:hypothetical protein
VDLPVSRTGVQFRYPPRFRVELQPGSFRTDTDRGPHAAAFGVGPTSRGGVVGGVVGGIDFIPEAPPLPPPAVIPEPAAANLQKLVDRFNNESGGRTVVGSLPVPVAFPAFGPSMFLATELTAESQAPAIELEFRKR